MLAKKGLGATEDDEKQWGTYCCAESGIPYCPSVCSDSHTAQLDINLYAVQQPPGGQPTPHQRRTRAVAHACGPGNAPCSEQGSNEAVAQTRWLNDTPHVPFGTCEASLFDCEKRHFY